MGFLGFGGGDAGTMGGAMRVETMEAAAQAETERLEALRNRVRELDEERRLLLDATRTLKPGLGPKVLGQTLLDLCLGPLDLYTFYIAIADYAADQLSFPYYFEGGKARTLIPERMSTFDGLTTKTMAAGESRYFPTLDAQTEVGVVFTEAERITGLIPQAWYGVPLGVGPGWTGPAFGLVSFQCFQPDAFGESRRDLMDALGCVVAFALKAAPPRRQAASA
jgi:hypothetical protein